MWKSCCGCRATVSSRNPFRPSAVACCMSRAPSALRWPRCSATSTFRIVPPCCRRWPWPRRRAQACWMSAPVPAARRAFWPSLSGRAASCWATNPPAPGWRPCGPTCRPATCFPWAPAVTRGRPCPCARAAGTPFSWIRPVPAGARRKSIPGSWNCGRATRCSPSSGCNACCCVMPRPCWLRGGGWSIPPAPPTWPKTRSRCALPKRTSVWSACRCRPFRALSGRSCRAARARCAWMGGDPVRRASMWPCCASLSRRRRTPVRRRRIPQPPGMCRAAGAEAAGATRPDRNCPVTRWPGRAAIPICCRRAGSCCLAIWCVSCRRTPPVCCRRASSGRGRCWAGLPGAGLCPRRVCARSCRVGPKRMPHSCWTARKR